MFTTAGLSFLAGAQTVARVRDVGSGLLSDAPGDQLATLDGHAGPVSSVAFSPGGGTLATATENGTVQLWDMRSSALVKTLKGLTGIVDSVAFSPSPHTLAAGGRDGTVLLWNLARRTGLGAALKAHVGSVYSVSFSPDGRELAVASANGTVALWDVRHHTRLGTLNNHAGAISSVAFRPHGSAFAAADINGTIVLWDLRSRQRLGKPLATHHLVSSVEFSPNGRTLAAGNGDNGTLTLWNVQTHHLSATLRTGDRGPVNSVAFSPKGTPSPPAARTGPSNCRTPEATPSSRRSAPAQAKYLASRSVPTGDSSPRQASPGR